MPHYKKRADGRFSAQIRTGKFKDNGKPEVITLYADTSKELEELVANKRYELTHGLYCFSSGTSFGEYASEWVKVKKANTSIKTQNNYAALLKNYIEQIKDKPIGKVTQLDLQRQINAHADIPRTCQLLAQLFDQVFASAVNDQLILRSPSFELTLPKYTPTSKRALTKEEKEAIKNADFTLQERAYLMLLYCCGLRPGELQALTWPDVDLTEGEVHVSKALTYDHNAPVVKEPKTNNGFRTVPIPPLALSALKAYKRSAPTSITRVVFGTDGGRYLKASQYETIFDKIRDKIYYQIGKPTGLCAYIFRHNYATQLYYSNVSLKEAARLMGHKDLKMIMDVYAHLDAAKENTAEKIRNIAF